MKKLGLVMSVMVVLAGLAYASSIAIPWFADNAPADVGWPPKPAIDRNQVVTLIYLKNNTEDVLTAEITYFSQDGDNLGPEFPDNTFSISPKASISFRPVAVDPDGSVEGGTVGGLEGDEAVKVPDRPRDVNTKKNGSATISWVGGPNDLQGMVATAGNAISYAHLLPPGN
ncbi:MAG: hypothetical protein ACOYI9_10285 [Candidatus Hydrogenedentales bacterium]|jgi:hypothetical protein